MCDVRRIGGERGLCGGPGKRVDGCFLDDLRAFGINANQWTPAAQDEGEWHRTAEQGAEHFMSLQREKAKAGLRHAVVCPNVTGRTKRRIAQSKGLVLVHSPLLTSHKWRELVSSGRLVCRCHMTSLSGVTFVLFCFVFVFMLSLKPRPFVQSSFDMQAPRQPHVFCFVFLLFIWRYRFFRVFFVPLPLSR